MSLDTTVARATTEREVKRITLRSRFGRHKVIYELEIQRDERGDWRIVEFYDVGLRIGWLTEVISHANRTALMSAAESERWDNAYLGRRHLTYTPKQLGLGEVYDRLMNQNVRILFTSAGRVLRTPEVDCKATVVLEWETTSKHKGETDIEHHSTNVLSRLSVDTVA